MSRNVNVKKIRPILNLANVNKKLLELFQNETIRPILKLQHDMTFALLEIQDNFNINKYSNLLKLQVEELLLKFIQTNLIFKNQLIGMVIGLFTVEEFKYYSLHKKECNRRIIQMQTKRFTDTIS